MRVLRSILITGVLTLPWAPGTASADTVDAKIMAARQLFLQGMDGDKRVVREALLRFRQLKDTHPGHPLVQAYIGACEALQGRDGGNVADQRASTEQAIRDLNAALAFLPQWPRDDLSTVMETKLVAADAFIHMPGIFNRRQKGEQLLQELTGDPSLSLMSSSFQSAVMVAAATLARMKDRPLDSTTLLLRARELDPEGRDGQRAQHMLAGETQ
jgi:hypothetical protein